MSNLPDQKNIYIEPYKPSILAKKIDNLLFLYVLALGFLIFIYTADNVFFLNWHVAEILFSHKYPYLLGVTLMVVVIAFLNGTFTRQIIKEDDIFEMMRDLKGEKIKRNISLILTENNQITRGELKEIVIAIKSEIMQLHKDSYRDIAEESDISKNKKLIIDLNMDLRVIGQILIRN